jgi:hypothetical protein
MILQVFIFLLQFVDKELLGLDLAFRAFKLNLHLLKQVTVLIRSRLVVFDLLSE